MPFVNPVNTADGVCTVWDCPDDNATLYEVAPVTGAKLTFKVPLATLTVGRPAIPTIVTGSEGAEAAEVAVGVMERSAWTVNVTVVPARNPTIFTVDAVVGIAIPVELRRT